MSFDPAKPADNSPLSSAEMRGQLTALKTLIDGVPTRLDLDNTVNANAALNVDSFPPLPLTVSNPPTRAEVQSIVDKLNQLIGALQH